jgi:hypothetical protein
MSHGRTGYGAWTTSGVRKSYSDVKGVELQNTSATGPFAIKPFSDVDTEANTAPHFDDLILYRTIPDLVAKIGLAGRDWPDGIVGSATFNAQSISAARGSTVTPGDLGTATLSFPTVSVTATGGDLTYQTVTGPSNVEGLGVYGAGGVLAITSANSGAIKLGFTANAATFAITLADFGKNGAYADRAQLSFLNASDVVVATATVTGCAADGGLATFSVPSAIPPATPPLFRSVVVKALPAIDASMNTATTTFLISEAQACDTSATFCTTPLSTPANKCPYP